MIAGAGILSSLGDGTFEQDNLERCLKDPSIMLLQALFLWNQSFTRFHSVVTTHIDPANSIS